MTDWLPWAGVFMLGVLVTLWFLIESVREATTLGGPADVTKARRAFLVTAVLTIGVYLVYVVRGEAWLPY